MFTGIIEEMGLVKKIDRGSKSCILEIQCNEVLTDAKIGDSIATNGVCLTVTTMSSNSYTADVMPETLNKSSLGELKIGDRVNLERAMVANGRFGGHIVSGHIDGTGYIEKTMQDDNAIWYTIAADSSLLKYIVKKGSIAIDGISLTVADVSERNFKVSIIPHSQSKTNLQFKKTGSIVNLECDIIGKYVEKLMGYKKEEEKSNITEAFLIQNGF